MYNYKYIQIADFGKYVQPKYLFTFKKNKKYLGGTFEKLLSTFHPVVLTSKIIIIVQF